MRGHFFFFTFIFCCIVTACTSTGDGRKNPASVDYFTPDGKQTGAPSATGTIDTFTVAMTGDIMLGTTYPDSILPPNGGRSLFKEVAGILSRADLAAGNLEGTLCDTLHSTRKKDTTHFYAFRTPPEMAVRLKEAGYDFLSMANNHALDFGYSGVRSTEHTLDSLGIRYAGLSGRTVCTTLERRGLTYGICAFGHNGYTLSHNNLATVKSILDSLNSVADIVIVSFHGGGEGQAFVHLPYDKEEFLGENRGSLRRFAHFCIDNGADIVFGHGPHVVRCVELYKDRFIAYSLGNFCTPYGISTAGLSGHAPIIEAKTDRDGHFLAGRIHPFVQRRGTGPRRDTTGVVIRQIRNLTITDIPEGRLTIFPDGRIEKRR